MQSMRISFEKKLTELKSVINKNNENFKIQICEKEREIDKLKLDNDVLLKRFKHLTGTN